MITFTKVLAFIQLLAGFIGGITLLEFGSDAVTGISRYGFKEYGTNWVMVGSGVGMIVGSLILFCIMMLLCKVCEQTCNN